MGSWVSRGRRGAGRADPAPGPPPGVQTRSCSCSWVPGLPAGGQGSEGCLPHAVQPGRHPDVNEHRSRQPQTWAVRARGGGGGVPAQTRSSPSTARLGPPRALAAAEPSAAPVPFGPKAPRPLSRSPAVLRRAWPTSLWARTEPGALPSSPASPRTLPVAPVGGQGLGSVCDAPAAPGILSCRAPHTPVPRQAACEARRWGSQAAPSRRNVSVPVTHV